LRVCVSVLEHQAMYLLAASYYIGGVLGVDMPGDEVDGKFALLGVLEKTVKERSIGGNGWTANKERTIQLLERRGRYFIQAVILLRRA
jgi:hypothetical protein